MLLFPSCDLIHIHVKYVPKGPIKNNSPQGQVMA